MKTTDIANSGLVQPKAAKQGLRGAAHQDGHGAFSRLVRPNELAVTAQAPRGERTDTVARHAAARDEIPADMTQPDPRFADHPDRVDGSDIDRDRSTPTGESASPKHEGIETARPHDRWNRRDGPDASGADAAPSTGMPAAIVTPPTLPQRLQHNGTKQSSDTTAETTANSSPSMTSGSNILDGKHEEPTADAAAPRIDFARNQTTNAPAENRLKPTFVGNAERPSHRDADQRSATLEPTAKSSTPEAAPISTERGMTKQVLPKPVPTERHSTPASTGASQPIPDHHVDQRPASPVEKAKLDMHGSAMAATADASDATGSASNPRAIAQPDRNPTAVRTSSPSPSKFPGTIEAPAQSEPARIEAVIGGAPRADASPRQEREGPAGPPAATSATPVPALNEPASADLKPQTVPIDTDGKATASMSNPGRPAASARPAAMATAGKTAQPVPLAGETSSDAVDRPPYLPSYRPAAAQVPPKSGAEIVSTKSEPVKAPLTVAPAASDHPATRSTVQPGIFVPLAPAKQSATPAKPDHPTTRPTAQSAISVPLAPAKESAAPAEAARTGAPSSGSATESNIAEATAETASASFAIELTAAAARYVNRQSARNDDTRPAPQTFDGEAMAVTDSLHEARTLSPLEPSRAPLPAMMWRSLSPAPATTATDTGRQAPLDKGLERPVSDTGTAAKHDDPDIDAANFADTGRSTQQSSAQGPVKTAETTAPLASPPLAVASAILSEPTWRATSVAQTPQSQSVRTPPVLKSLQVQLNPEHLGVVTATLTMSGTQLTVELSVTTREAHDRLKGEEQVIEKAVRSLGYDVGQVSIIQSLIVQNTPPRTDGAMPQPMAQGRDQAAGGMASGDGGNRSGNQQGGRHEGNASGAFGGTATRDADRRGGGVYI